MQQEIARLTGQIPFGRTLLGGRDGVWVYRPGMGIRGAHTRRGFRSRVAIKAPGDPMSFNQYVAHVAECERRAKTARTAEDKHSWLAMAESWRKSAELRLILERQNKFIHKTAAPVLQV